MPRVMETIRVESIVKRFGAVTALDGVSLEIPAGELYFLLGASGCGKTTLLRCIAGLEEPSEGAIFFGEDEVTRLPPHRREAAMMFQSYALWPHLSVARNVGFGLEERKVAKEEIQARVEEALAMVRLEGMGERGVDQLSGGQQQRVALARALVVRPRCLLLDEPLSNLDAKLRLEMRREIRRIVKEGGLTAVYVTHDQEEALATGDRIALLEGGRIAQVGAPEEVYRSPRSAFVAGFIGETNLIAGRIVEVRDGFARVASEAGPLVGRLTDPEWRPGRDEAVRVSIRPEACVLGGAGENRLRGRIVERSYLGASVQYRLESDAGPLRVVAMNPPRVRDPGAEELEIGCRHVDAVVVRGAAG